MICKYKSWSMNHVVVIGSMYALTGCMFVIVGLVEPPEDEAIQRLRNAETPRELAKCYQQIFGEATIEQLKEFESQSDYHLAIPAGWELLRRTLPKKRRDDIIYHDEKALSKFLDSVEDHIKVDVPSAWRKAVLSAQLPGRSDIWYVMPQFLKIPHAFIEDEQGSRPATLRSADEGFEFVTEDEIEIWKVPLLERPMPPHPCARLEVTKESLFFARYPFVPIPFDLQAMDRKSGKVVWSTQVWAAGDFTGYRGPHWHYVDFVVKDEMLIVFGLSVGSMYIEKFDVKTGKNLFRFNQIYLEIDLS
ncbi:MAG: hypothetical protein IIB54_12705 [Planctomycetes bacterium]|nr:hypothetical protein [Planctomycetota bacterium]